MSEDQVEIARACTELAAIVGPENVRATTADDAVDGAQPAAVIAPRTSQQVAEVLRCCNAAGLAVIPRGGGTKLALGNRPRKADFILSTERLNQLIEHAWEDMTATVEAGCTIAAFQAALNEHRQRLAADVVAPERATVGGILATAESGTFRIRYGAMRDLVLGLELALPDGNLIRAGGKVVKNVAGFDLTKLAIGSLGTMGVITRATFRLHPIAPTSMSVFTQLPSTAGLAELVVAIMHSNVVFSGLQIRAEAPDCIFVDVRVDGILDALREHLARLNAISSAHQFNESCDVWSERRKLYSNSAGSTICKCAVLPAQIGSLCDMVFRRTQSAGATARFVAQATGIAEVRIDAPGQATQLSVVNVLRADLAAFGGTLIVLQCPAGVKAQLDVWGPINSSLPIMRRIKDKFDPARILNPGRFVGGL